jgi:tetratricopeptide (TPR) repeat protein
VLRCGDFASWMVAPLLATDRPAPGVDLLELLVDARLVDVVRGPDGPRFHLPDLLRVYARERLAEEESPAERTAALDRCVGALLLLTERAHPRLDGGDYTRLRGSAPRWTLAPDTVDALLADPRRWFEGERATIVAMVDQAARTGRHEPAWELAMSAVAHFERGAYFDDWRETHETALDAAQRHGNRRGAAAMRYSLGALAVAEQRPDEASVQLTAAWQAFQDLGEQHGAALALRHLAFLDRLRGRPDDAVATYEQALSMLRTVGDRVAEAHVRHGLGRTYHDREQHSAARRLLEEAARICRDTTTSRFSGR